MAYKQHSSTTTFTNVENLRHCLCLLMAVVLGLSFPVWVSSVCLGMVIFSWDLTIWEACSLLDCFTSISENKYPYPYLTIRYMLFSHYSVRLNCEVLCHSSCSLILFYCLNSACKILQLLVVFHQQHKILIDYCISYQHFCKWSLNSLILSIFPKLMDTRCVPVWS